MARTYTEADRAKVYIVLASNDQNVKRTARETGIPENTVRRWKQLFIQNGPPVIEEDLVRDVGDFLETAEKTRWKAIQVLDQKIPDAKPSELITIVGVLSDKIDRVKGLAIGRVEHVHALPSPDEIRESLGAALQGVLDAAQQRQHEIIDAEIVEQSQSGELPPART